ncbi:hypothetical protein Cantr_06094 [Candida viswanathii]|uniref:Uncharacterized protein n=1 Tax=Candida viswanathii TaxID=5486 RepID=A0A367XVX2_9ASCO|nr:hypothetical protein Cantr_06094 [Candida viswanathii]
MVSTVSGSNDVSGVDSAGVDSAGVDSPGVDSTEVDSTEVDSAGVDSAGVDSAGVDSPGVDSAGVDSPGVVSGVVSGVASEVVSGVVSIVEDVVEGTATVEQMTVLVFHQNFLSRGNGHGGTNDRASLPPEFFVVTSSTRSWDTWRSGGTFSSSSSALWGRHRCCLNSGRSRGNGHGGTNDRASLPPEFLVVTSSTRSWDTWRSGGTFSSSSSALWGRHRCCLNSGRSRGNGHGGTNDRASLPPEFLVVTSSTRSWDTWRSGGTFSSSSSALWGRHRCCLNSGRSRGNGHGGTNDRASLPPEFLVVTSSTRSWDTWGCSRSDSRYGGSGLATVRWFWPAPVPWRVLGGPNNKRVRTSRLNNFMGCS